MSAFVGIVRFEPDSFVPAVDFLHLPGHPGLQPLRLWRGPNVAFALRQRIVTPEDAFETQPSPAWDGTGAVVFDGRLDDREGLSESLGVAVPRNLPDSVLAAKAFERWGPDSAAKIVGDFALAVWNGLEKRLMLSTGRSGTRPLYFCRSRETVVFSNVLPALLAFPGIPGDLDEQAMADFLASNNHDTQRSFYRGVSRVLGGTTVVINSGGERIVSNWDMSKPRELRLGSDDQYVEAAREVLDRAVRARLRSIKPVPLMGSGGLDTSSIIVSVLGMNNGAPLRMVTMVPEPGVTLFAAKSEYPSERAPVEALCAAFPRLQAEFVNPEPRPDLSFSPEAIFDEVAIPFRNVLTVGSAGMARRRLQEMGASSILNGGEGNITLSWGGTRGLGTLFEQGRWITLARETSALGDHRPRAVAGHLWREIVRPCLPQSTWKNAWHKYTPLHPLAASQYNVEGARKASGYVPGIAQRRDLHRWWIVRLKVGRALLGEFQSWVRVRYGFEIRSPLADSRVADFCLSIPPDQFLRNGRTRWLMRRLLASAGVPSSVVNTTTRGAPNPQWFAHLNRFRDLLPARMRLLRESPLASRMLDIDKLERIVNDWPADVESAQAKRYEIDMLLTRALHAGAFMRWAESRQKPSSGIDGQSLPLVASGTAR